MHVMEKKFGTYRFYLLYEPVKRSGIWLGWTFHFVPNRADSQLTALQTHVQQEGAVLIQNLGIERDVVSCLYETEP